MNEQLTIRQVIGITIELLSNINVPVKLNEQIGQPLAGAVQNLTMCVEAMDRDEKARQEAQEAETAPEEETTNEAEG